MVTAASVVAAVGTVAGLVSALDDRGGGTDRARPEASRTPALEPLPAVPSPTAAPHTRKPKPSPSKSSSAAKGKPRPGPVPSSARPQPSGPPAAANRLYRHGDSQVLDWVRAHRGDPRRPLIESRIAARPAAVWFADYRPGTITARVRAVTSAASGRVPVLVPYAIPDRDCGGASQGGAPDLAAYDAWIEKFAAGLGSGEVIVILEPDALAQTECLSRAGRAERYASLARAGRVLKAADPRARVYFDAGHSGWHAPAAQAARLRSAGAASPASSDGIFTNVSNFQGTGAEVAYARRVLAALGGPASLGAVIDTSRNGNGAPADGEWCDPGGRGLGRAPTPATGEPRIDGYLWVKLPGESDGCAGEPGTFAPQYAYDLARG
ncbi:glycoside hydrolase family 6 protein [Actinomycetota bacterium Odt1-20B]